MRRGFCTIGAGWTSVDRLAQRAWANVEELNFKGENPKLEWAR